MTSKPSEAELHDHTGEEDDMVAELYDDDVLEIVEEDGDEPMDEDDDGEDGAGEHDDKPDTSASRFTGHGKSVFAVATHSTLPILCASGGEDDNGYLWDAQSGRQIAKLSGHTDSVVAVEFSNDGQFVATGGMDGRVRVWKLREEGSQWEFLTSLEGPEEITWLVWHPKGPVLLAGGSDGTSWMWQLPTGRVMNVFAGHTKSVTCGRFTPDGKQIVTASEDASLIIWDPKSGSPQHKLILSEGKFRMPAGAISIAINAAATIAVLGGVEGGTIRIVNLVSGQVVAALGGHEEEASVEAVKLCEGASGVSLLVSGGTDGRVCIYDAVTYRLRTTVNHDDAVTSITIHPTQPYATSASADRTLRTWDLRTGKMLAEHTGHDQVVHSVRYSSDGSFLVSGSDDGTACCFVMKEQNEGEGVASS